MTPKEDQENEFDRDRHVLYFSYSLRQLPRPYSSLDTNRLTLAHFAIQALDLLGEPPKNSNDVIEWIYSLQQNGGFMGGTCTTEPYNHAHIAMTYTALSSLLTLGDDLSRVDKESIVENLRHLQRHDGSFQCVRFGSEYDMRFLYCACAISHIVGDWSGVDKDRAVDYIRGCRSFDGAIALIPNQEGHGGSTFCGVASLVLMKRLDVLADRSWKSDLIQWCVSRQVGGMQGRPNKAEDTCYSFWIGGTLRLLGHDHLLHHEKLREYVLSCQHRHYGGFGKVVGANPDVLHSFYSLAWLSLSSKHLPSLGLKELDCVLGVPR